MKFLPLVAMLILSCGTQNKENPDVNASANQDLNKHKRELSTGFQTILDSARLKGAILILDVVGNTFYSNDFQWCETGFLPASTFKIPNSITALETGVVESDSTFFKWDGEPKWLKAWEQDLIFRDAFKYSCVHCYQEVAREIGGVRMNEYLGKLDFGTMEVDSTNLDQFWLRGNSRISPFEQIDFLKRFYNSELPIAERTESIVKSMMLLEESDKYKIYGKTGWSVDGEKNNGWFVGFLETFEKTYFYAANVEPASEFDQGEFLKGRKEVISEAFREKRVIGSE